MRGGSLEECLLSVQYRKMTIWCCSIFVILHLACFVVSLEQDQDRQLICMCTNTHCKNTNRTTCHTLFKCYTQYLDRMDGSSPITRGCVQGNTPILCENRLPMPAITKTQGYKWPYLECCDTDFCNNAESITPPSWYTTPTRVQHTTLSIETSTSGISAHVNSRVVALGVANTNTTSYDWPISKSVVLTVLFVGLFLLIIILSFGFYILKIQSNYLRQLSQGYVRAREEDTPVVRANDCEVALVSLSRKNNERTK